MEDLSPMLQRWILELSEPPASTTIEGLPIELRRLILKLLELPDLGLMRLASSSWADLGRQYLFGPSYVVYTDFHDIRRLEAISKDSRVAPSIKSLTFNFGMLNEKNARRTARRLHRARPVLKHALIEHEGQKLFRKEFFNLSSQVRLLAGIFGRLPNLSRISISLMNCPFRWFPNSSELLREVWNFPSSRRMPRSATIDRLNKILTAILMNPHLCIQSFAHDRIPLEFFLQKRPTLRCLTKVFGHLRNLSLTLSEKRHADDSETKFMLTRLAACLRAATSLRTLRLGFRCSGKKNKLCISALLNSFIEAQYSFRDLEQVWLEGMSCSFAALSGFLIAQPRLRMIWLGGVGERSPGHPPRGGVVLLDGTFWALVDRLCDVLWELELLRFMGDMAELGTGNKILIGPLRVRITYINDAKKPQNQAYK